MTSVKDISTKPPAASAAPALMTDFHRTLDSAISSQVSPELPQADLMDFLMHGRGWLLLNAMSILATQVRYLMYYIRGVGCIKGFKASDNSQCQFESLLMILDKN